MKYSKASTTIEKKQRNVRQLTDQWTRRRRRRKQFSIKRVQCTNKRKQKKYSNFRLRFSTSCQFQSGKNNALTRTIHLKK
jgi:hypothetical protein